MQAGLAESIVLIVDDDADGVETLRFVLQNYGYHVDVAGNGLEALQYFEAGHRPCVVILDLMMPVMDGLEFLSRRKLDPVVAGTPVVVLTASHTGLEPGDGPVLRKPVDVGALLGQIRAACADRPCGEPH